MLFGSILLVGWAMGPEHQGVFSRVKAEIEFVAAVVLIGLPQATFYYLSTGRLSFRRAGRLTAVLAVLTFLLAVFYRSLFSSGSMLFLVMFAAAAAVFVVHSQMRVMLLAFAPTSAFNSATTVPQLVIFALTVFAVASGTMTELQIAVIVIIAYLAGCIYARSVAGNSAGVPCMPDDTPTAVGWSEVVRFSLSGGGVALLGGLATLSAVRFIESTQGTTSLGHFTMALTLVQVLAMPVTFAAPLLFKLRMSGVSRPMRLHDCGALAVLAFASMWSLSLVLTPFLDPYVHRAYGALIDLQLPILIAATAELTLKFASPAALAAAQPYLLIPPELARLVMLALGVGSGHAATLHGALFIWAIAAALAAATLLLLLQITDRGAA